MQIKFDKFLALTTMLASAQLNGCVTVEDGDEAKADSGTTDTNKTSDNTGASSNNTTSSSAQGSTSVVDVTGVVDGGAVDGGGADGAVVDGAVGDGAVDGGVFGDASALADAGGEGSDASDESTPDAGDEGAICDLGDVAAELWPANCAAVADSCLETSYPGVGDLCFIYAAERRFGVTEAFWDCYTALEIADPCTEEAESAAYGCADAADEGICVTPLSDCVTIDAACPAIGADYCEYTLASYNSRYVASVAACAADKAEGLDPGYEGCLGAFTDCVLSPSAE